jgi:5-bromo-4-chloroindolyl phosphate hydrolysis protein
MSRQEWERFGEEICRNVQDAVDSGDFSRLSRTVTDAVNGAADSLSRTMRGMGGTPGDNGGQNRRETGNRYRYSTDQEYNGGGYQYHTGTENRENAYRNKAKAWRQKQEANFSGMQKAKGSSLPVLYASAASTKVGGILLSVFGYSLSIVNLLGFIVAFVFTMNSPEAAGVAVTSACAVLSAVTVAMAAAGTKMLGGFKRFRSYIRALGEREYCRIEELADRIGKNSKFVTKDLERMIQKGWFRQGHLDEQKTCLMVSNKAYGQYQALMEQTRKQEQEERERKERERKRAEQEERDAAKLSPEVREVIEAGEEYIRRIHACNDAIPGEEISAKISRMEMLVDRIFDRVEEEPETVSDLHRMMNYYLPTTVKLLEAYEDLDAEPVQGENIRNSKREIEKTLDTLNTAFEKLLDSMYQDTAWDVSSDISVLRTMLAQEGLTEDGLKDKKE